MHEEFHISEAFHEGICVVAVHGVFNQPNHSGVVRRFFEERIDRGMRFFVLDLTGSGYVNSTGIGDLAAVATRVRMRHGRMLLVATKKMSDLFYLTRIHGLLETAEDTAHAVAALLDRECSPLPPLNYKKCFSITLQGEGENMRYVISDNMGALPATQEFQVHQVDGSKAASPDVLLRSTLLAVGALVVTLAGVVWVAKQVTSITVLTLLFSVAIMVFIGVLLLILTMTGWLNPKTTEKVLLGTLGKIPGLGQLIPTPTSKRKPH